MLAQVLDSSIFDDEFRHVESMPKKKHWQELSCWEISNRAKQKRFTVLGCIRKTASRCLCWCPQH